MLKSMKWVTGALTIALALTAVILDLTIYFGYSGSGQMYTESGIGMRLKILLIPFVLWLAAAITTGVLVVKNYDTADDRPKRTDYQAPARNKKAVLIARVVLLFLGIGLIIFGILNGSLRDVLYKAINICTECIGLG